MLASVTTVLLAAILMSAHPTRPKPVATRHAQIAINGFRPSVRWHQVLRADINCEGSSDNIFTGRDDDHFYVAAVLAGLTSRPKISLATCQLCGGAEDSLCGEPSLLEKESMNYDPTEALGEIPNGFRRSSKCHGLRLVAGECDSFHLFWNHVTNELDWWRL